MRIVDYILHHGSTCPDKTAVVCQNKSVTYRQLAEFIQRAACELKKNNCSAVVFRALPSEEFIVEYFSIHLAGKVAIPLERDVRDDVMSEISTRVDGYCFPDNTADVLFTTGTTGKQKGVVISHDVLIANAENLIEAQGYSSETVFITCGPLNHIGSLSKLYPTFMLGGTVVVTEGMKDINAFYQALDYPSNKLASFLVPASIRMLLAFSVDRLASYAHKIDFIETGAAAISQDDMEKLCKVLPCTRLYNTYASTETGIIATYNFNQGQCLAGCLGRVMKNSSIEIVDGKIVCKGKTLMTCYFDDQQQTESVLYGKELHTNDIGHLDKNGLLHLVGRDDDTINVGGYKVAPTEVENLVLKIEGISDCICIPYMHPVLGTALKLLYVQGEGFEIKPKRIAESLKDKLESYKIPTMYGCVEDIKRTYNGKLNRKFYR